MSIEDQKDRGPKVTESAQTVRAEDDFVLRGQIKRPYQPDATPERRMHLRAFDYWHGLNAGRQFPQFEDLTPEGLTPFKQNCLLLEYHGGDMVVRFCGSEMAVLFGDALAPGTHLGNSRPTSFSRALQQRLSLSQGRQEAAEFEFIDGPVECRGTLLPFSARGEMAEFVMMVVNYRQKSITEATQAVTPQPSTDDAVGTADKMAALAVLAADCANAGSTVVHPGIGTREGLYLALAQAYRFHVAASRDPASYKKFLRSNGMRQQQRAPYTPALKLTFGASYDKTRLTEYAAALSCAARNEVGPDGLTDFLKNHPGGIKGCVQEERAARQGKHGTGQQARLSNARVKARQMAPVSLEEISLSQEFELALVRRNRDGSAQLLSPVQTSKHIIDKAITQVASKSKN